MDKSIVPDWLQAELKEAESEEKQKKRKQRRRKPKKKNVQGKAQVAVESPEQHPNYVSSEKEEITSAQLERMKKLEKEYERRQQEIMMEAELAVRAREEALNQELYRLREELDRQRQLQSEYMQEKAAGMVNSEPTKRKSECQIQ